MIVPSVNVSLGLCVFGLKCCVYLCMCVREFQPPSKDDFKTLSPGRGPVMSARTQQELPICRVRCLPQLVTQCVTV